MELSYPEDSKSSSEETDRSSEHINDLHDVGTGRTFECVFCKRGFTTAQALGGHMNIHRKDRANNNNKAKPNFPSSSSSKVIDDNYADLGYYYSSIQSCHLAKRGNNYSTIVPDHEVVTNNNYQYHPSYFPPHSCGGTTPSSHVHYNSEVLCVENQRDRGNLFGQDSRQKSLSLYTNPLCVHENNDQIKDNNSEEDGLDLELRLGHP